MVQCHPTSLKRKFNKSNTTDMHVDVFDMFCLKSTMHNCAFKHASVKKMNTKIDTANNYEQNETV